MPAEFENTCNNAGVPGVQLSSLTLTIPSGTVAAASSTSGSGSTGVSIPSTAVTLTSNLAGTITTSVGTTNTVLPAPTTAATTAASAVNPSSSSSALNPLSHNGAGVAGVSFASVLFAGLVGGTMVVFS